MPISQCIHKDNVFTGRSSHANSASKLIKIFANLEAISIAYSTVNRHFLESLPF
jgi:hypothetical protein